MSSTVLRYGALQHQVHCDHKLTRGGRVRRASKILPTFQPGENSRRIPAFWSFRPAPGIRRFRLVGWCCRKGLNFRPLPYQGSALPLSYGSVPVRRSPRRQRKPIHEAPKAGKIGGPAAVDAASFPNPFAGSGIHTAVYHVGRKRFCCLLTPITAGKSGTPTTNSLTDS